MIQARAPRQSQHDRAGSRADRRPSAEIGTGFAFRKAARVPNREAPHQIQQIGADGSRDPEISDVDDIGMARLAACLRFLLEPP
jgi:hypothetical protein